MITLNDVRKKISDYCILYRKEGLPPIQESPVYILNENYVGEQCDSDARWPQAYPHAGNRGVYAIFGVDGLLYIGKASIGTIGERLSSYFQYFKNREGFKTNPQHTWSAPPTHVVVWAVPDDMPFEASALEEFLIGSFKGNLSDNRIGNRC